MRDLTEFNDFMLDVVRSVDGVRETRTTLSFSGRADIDTLLELEMEVNPSSSTVAASVWIDVKPGMDRACFQALLDLPEHPEVRRVWLPQLLPQRGRRPAAAFVGQACGGVDRLRHELDTHRTRRGGYGDEFRTGLALDGQPGRRGRVM